MVGCGCWNFQLHFGSGFRAAPQLHLRTNFARPFTHTRQTPVPGTSFCFESLGANAFPIIVNTHRHLLLVVTNGDFHAMCLCVAEGIAQPLSSYPVDFIPQDRLQLPWRPFHFDMKGGRTLLAIHRCKVSPQRIEGCGEIAA